MAGHTHTHGILMWTSFLILFPLGTFLIRAPPSRSAFARHWIVQLLATVLALAGAFIGLSHTHFSRPSSPHTILGSLVALSLVTQALLGWRHHVKFVEVRRRTWLSHAHIWLGRVVLLGGWTNVMIGMSHHVHHLLGVSATVLAGGLIVLEGVGIGFWLWVAERRRTIEEKVKGVGGVGEEGVALTAGAGAGARGRVGDEYFALGISDDEGEDGDDRKERKSIDVTSSPIGPK